MTSVTDINFRILTYEVNVGIYVCDTQGNFIYANLALADIFGVEHPRDILGKNFMDFIAPENARAFSEQFRSSMTSGPHARSISSKIIRPDGNSAFIEVRAMPFINDRVLEGNQGVVHDITQIRQAIQKIMNSSTHDTLTGIYNRTFFEEEMKRLERGRQYPISILVVEVEGLEKYREADRQRDEEKMLLRIARQLFYTFRGDDIIARIGENQFGVLFPNVDEPIIEKIIRRMQIDLLALIADESGPELSFYIGASTARDGESLEPVLKKARAVVALKKKSGLGR